MNEYLTEAFQYIKGDYFFDVESYITRYPLLKKYSFAIPNEEAIHVIKDISLDYPVIELGAGAGYWAYLIQQIGGNITPYDIGDWFWGNQWTHIHQSNEEILIGKKDISLFLCWPPYDEDMGYNCLKLFEGPIFIYVGEGPFGCCANRKFFDLLDEEWTPELSISIPQWPGIHDSLVVYKKLG
jgi:hypothetical protein